MCPIFVGSAHKFDRSDDDNNLVKKCLNPIGAYFILDAQLDQKVCDVHKRSMFYIFLSLLLFSSYKNI